MENTNKYTKNYQKELEKELSRICAQGIVPTLLMHTCCAPCSSYCLEYLSEYFRITVFYYNPQYLSAGGILQARGRAAGFYPTYSGEVSGPFVEGSYDMARFYEVTKGLADVKEGGERCFLCYELRLRERRLRWQRSWEWIILRRRFRSVRAKMRESSTRSEESAGRNSTASVI